MSKKQSSTPHDALFKLFLRQPDTARDFLAFHLPAPIHALCDMKTLKLESSSFIDDDLRESYSDVLWSVKTEQGPGYIYCLILVINRTAYRNSSPALSTVLSEEKCRANTY